MGGDAHASERKEYRRLSAMVPVEIRLDCLAVSRAFLSRS